MKKRYVFLSCFLLVCYFLTNLPSFATTDHNAALFANPQQPLANDIGINPSRIAPGGIIENNTRHTYLTPEIEQRNSAYYYEEREKYADHILNISGMMLDHATGLVTVFIALFSISISILLAVGTFLYRRTTNRIKELECFEQKHELFKVLYDVNLCTLYGDMETAKYHLGHALKLVQTFEAGWKNIDIDFEKAKILRVISFILQARGENKEALAKYQDAFWLLRKHASNDYRIVHLTADILHSMLLLVRLSGKKPDFFTSLIKDFKKKSKKSNIYSINLSRLYRKIGIWYFLLNEFTKSLKWLKEARSILDVISRNDHQQSNSILQIEKALLMRDEGTFLVFSDKTDVKFKTKAVGDDSLERWKEDAKLGISLLKEARDNVRYIFKDTQDPNSIYNIAMVSLHLGKAYESRADYKNAHETLKSVEKQADLLYKVNRANIHWVQLVMNTNAIMGDISSIYNHDSVGENDAATSVPVPAEYYTRAYEAICYLSDISPQNVAWEIEKIHLELLLSSPEKILEFSWATQKIRDYQKNIHLYVESPSFSKKELLCRLIRICYLRGDYHWRERKMEKAKLFYVEAANLTANEQSINFPYDILKREKTEARYRKTKFLDEKDKAELEDLLKNAKELNNQYKETMKLDHPRWKRIAIDIEERIERLSK